MKEIEEKEYRDIYRENSDNLCVYGSYTDTTGHGYEWSTGDPQWMTEWGLKGGDKLLIRAESETIEGVTTHNYFKY